MVDLNIDKVMDVLTQTIFGGNSLVAGMTFLVMAFLIVLAVFSKLGTPPVYALVPMIPLVILFGYLGIMDPTVGMLIIIISVVMVGIYARRLAGGGSE